MVWIISVFASFFIAVALYSCITVGAKADKNMKDIKKARKKE